MYSALFGVVIIEAFMVFLKRVVMKEVSLVVTRDTVG